MTRPPCDPKSSFANALDLPPDDRPAYLDAACGGDSALRAEISALLAADAHAGAFLGGAAAPPDGTSAHAAVSASTARSNRKLASGSRESR